MSTSTYNTCIKLTDEAKGEMKQMLSQDSRIFPDRNKVIDLCEQLGFYSPQIAEMLRREEIPE